MSVQKDEIIRLRVEAEIKARYEAAAAYRGLNLSAWLRQLAIVDMRAIDSEKRQAGMVDDEQVSAA